MRHKFLFCNCKVPMNLQVFAGGGDEAGAEGGNGDGTNAGGGSSSEEDQTKPLSFDDFLKDKGNQAEFDRRVQKATNTAVSNAQSKWQLIANDKASEAEKFAAMTNEEKAKYERDNLQKKLDELLAKDTLNEMSKTARSILADSKISISDELLNFMVSTDAEKTKAAVDSFAKMFKAEVEKAVKDALKGETPAAGKGAAKMTKEKILGIKDRVERQKAIQQHIELFE